MKFLYVHKCIELKFHFDIGLFFTLMEAETDSKKLTPGRERVGKRIHFSRQVDQAHWSQSAAQRGGHQVPLSCLIFIPCHV
jgi:hypothetical protein